MGLNYIDIHTHSHYRRKGVTVVQNVFPGQDDQLDNGNYFSVGLHPWNVNKHSMDKDIDWVKAHAAERNIIAIGEIGLDKSIDCPWEDQQTAFERQLSVAAEVNKPVILHCVRAYSEMLAYRKQSEHKSPWIFHWFNADIRIAEELIRKNCFLSFGHMLFKEGSKAFKAFRSVPVEHLFFETDDAGYSINEIYEQAALLRNMDMNELKKHILGNFKKCFSLE
ncbi:MAG: TatD family hydrolase [Bacteroidales bacterium]|nr:TatD family hydrolase [Bacteroidales bacterium]